MSAPAAQPANSGGIGTGSVEVTRVRSRTT